MDSYGVSCNLKCGDQPCLSIRDAGSDPGVAEQPSWPDKRTPEAGRVVAKSETSKRAKPCRAEAVLASTGLLSRLTLETAVTGCSVGGWPTAAAQGRPRGCAEPASSRAGPAARASRPPPRRRAAARRHGGLRAARGAARTVLALHLRRGRRDFGQGIAAASRQGQRTALEQRRVAVGEEKQRGCH